MQLPLTISRVVITATGIALAAGPAFAKADDHGAGNEAAVYVNSTPEAYAAMQELPIDEPIFMLNLIRFKDEADYGEGSEFSSKGWTGEQAYAEYSRISSPIARRVGGKVAFAALPQLNLIGPEHEQWDVAFVVSYPNLASFLALVNDPEYAQHAFHRKAAVADSRLVRMAAFPVPE